MRFPLRPLTAYGIEIPSAELSAESTTLFNRGWITRTSPGSYQTNGAELIMDTARSYFRIWVRGLTFPMYKPIKVRT
jgi:hypothetical protein